MRMLSSRKRNQGKSEQISPPAPPKPPYSTPCSIGTARTKRWVYLQARAHGRKTEHQARPQPDCSIQYERTVTTPAFHVLFKIMRSGSPPLIEEERLFLPLNRHMSHGHGRSGRRKEMQKNNRTKKQKRFKFERKLRGSGGVLFSGPWVSLPGGSWWFLNPSHGAQPVNL